MHEANNTYELILAKKYSAHTIAGMDEVGRGALAGPLVTCCVVRNKNCQLPVVRDSKLLSHKQRLALIEPILDCCTAWSISMVSAQEISDRGMAWALPVAFNRALVQISFSPDIVLYDGRRLPLTHTKSFSVIDGDAQCAIIAAASIVAKVIRDLFMIELSATYPHYNFHQHKGYGTPQHRLAIKTRGVIPYVHRTSFTLL